MHTGTRLEPLRRLLHIKAPPKKKIAIDLARIVNELYWSTPRGAADSRNRAVEDLYHAFDSIMQAPKTRRIWHEIQFRPIEDSRTPTCGISLNVRKESAIMRRVEKRTVRVVERDGEVVVAFNVTGAPRKYGPDHRSVKELYACLKSALQETAENFGVELAVSPFAENAFYSMAPLAH